MCVCVCACVCVCVCVCVWITEGFSCLLGRVIDKIYRVLLLTVLVATVLELPAEQVLLSYIRTYSHNHLRA